MYFANTEDGKRIAIEKAEKGKKYFCPCCKSEMIQKKGEFVAQHFAHKSNKECDSWYSENKGPWHRRMQSYFSEECQEIKIESDSSECYHIADVFLKQEYSNVIVEFQHSSITSNEFVERSKFYIHNNCNKDKYGNKCLNSIIWVFDMSDDRVGRMYISPVNKYSEYFFPTDIVDKLQGYVSASFDFVRPFKFLKLVGRDNGDSTFTEEEKNHIKVMIYIEVFHKVIKNVFILPKAIEDNYKTAYGICCKGDDLKFFDNSENRDNTVLNMFDEILSLQEKEIKRLANLMKIDFGQYLPVGFMKG